MGLKCGNVFIVQALTGHKTLDMVQRYMNITEDDVVELMHRPEAAATAPAAPPPQLRSAEIPAVTTQEALHTAMQMLQAATAQLNVQAAATAPASVHVPARPAANDDGDVGAFA
ncbi:MAG: hypothetical protein K0Q43_675 [Ramlibacter sp.]|jgi:hypothetical protein|nr:hypothetical protein [Ramlibacter sp.]